MIQVLIGGKIGGQCKIIQCIIRDAKITQGDKQITIPMSFINGLAFTTYQNKKYVLATDCGSRTIIAVDFDSGATLWKIQNAEYNGKPVVPYGICTDGGNHLLLADYDARRILVVYITGQIKSELVTNIDGNFCYNVSSLSSMDKFAVTHYHGGNVVSVYDIKSRSFQGD